LALSTEPPGRVARVNVSIARRAQAVAEFNSGPTVLLPKLVTTIRGYSRRQFFADLTAGMIVGIVALPLAIAFAIASGVTPRAGLVTAIVAGFLISALGGSRVQIGAPPAPLGGLFTVSSSTTGWTVGGSQPRWRGGFA
jgi:hypothetical protein